MDRRQKKTREAIFCAFTELLSQKHYHHITVHDIIERANVGRATFYAHFETKDFLLKELCEELFCHIFDATRTDGEVHSHIFHCDAPGSGILHLLQHLQKNDNHILDLLACENNELFLGYFREGLKDLIRKQPRLFGKEKAEGLPEEFWINHLSATFVEAVKWWVEGGRREDPETLSRYFEEVL